MSNKETIAAIWVEKYRPRKLEDFVCSDSYKRKFQQFVDNKVIDHILLSGQAGCGKSSMAKMLVNLIPCDKMYINASSERNIDIMRTKITDFSMHISDSGLNICILDEADGLCLDPNTEIIVGTVDNSYVIKIKDVPKEGCQIPSLNTETELIENDYCIPLNNLNKLICYQMQTEDGRSVICTENHPFFVRINDVIIEKKLWELQVGDEIIILE